MTNSRASSRISLSWTDRRGSAEATVRTIRHPNRSRPRPNSGQTSPPQGRRRIRLHRRRGSWASRREEGPSSVLGHGGRWPLQELSCLNSDGFSRVPPRPRSSTRQARRWIIADDHFAKALQDALQHPVVLPRTGSQATLPADKKIPVLQGFAAGARWCTSAEWRIGVSHLGRFSSGIVGFQGREGQNRGQLVTKTPQPTPLWPA